MRINRKLLTQGALMALGVGLGLFFGRLALQGARWQEVRETLQGWSLLALFVPVVLVLASSYLRALRWSFMWTTHRVSTVRLMLIENAALGLNNVSPVRIFDEGLELSILTLRDRLPGGVVLATIMMCRVQDLVFTLLFVTVAVAFLPELWQYSLVLAGGIVFLMGWLLLLLLLNRIVHRFPVLRRIPGVASFGKAVWDLWKQKRRLALTFSITCAYWLLLAPIGLLLARTAGIDIGFHLIMVAVLGGIFFATAVPGLPGALGTFEFAVVSLLELWDVPKAEAISFAIVLHAVLFLPITAFTIFVLPREGIASIGALRNILLNRQKSPLESGS